MTTFDAAPAWFKWALHELGTREEPENRGPAIRRYIELAHAGQEGDPWCAIFANAALEANGIPGTRSASSQSFRHHDQFISLITPTLGAVAVFWRKSPASGLGHVGFYRGETTNYVYVLGGNEGDQVQIEPMAKASQHFGLVGYFWPRSVPFPKLARITMPAHAPAHQVSVT